MGFPIIALAGSLMAGISTAGNNRLQRISYDQFSTPYRQRLAEQNCHSSSRADALIQCLPTAAPKDPPRLLLIGDSNAAHLRPVLANFGSQLIQLTDRNLPNLWLGQRCREPAYCYSSEQFNAAFEASLSPGSLVILGLSPRRLTGPRRNKDQTQQAADQLQQSLNSLIPVLERRRSPLLLIGGLPQVKCPTGQTFMSLFNRGGPDAVMNACSPSQNWIRTQNYAQDQVFEKLHKQHPSMVHIFETVPLVCTDDPCRLGNNSKELIVWDELAHLTASGYSHLESALQRKIQVLLSSGETSRL